LHSCRVGRELSRLGIFPDFLLDDPQFLLLSLTALLGPLLATLGLAFFHGARFASAARALAKASSGTAVCSRAAGCAAEAAACETAGGAIAGCARVDSELTASACA
jgi:hypothetical protein